MVVSILLSCSQIGLEFRCPIFIPGPAGCLGGVNALLISFSSSSTGSRPLSTPHRQGSAAFARIRSIPLGGSMYFPLAQAWLLLVRNRSGSTLLA